MVIIGLTRMMIGKFEDIQHPIGTLVSVILLRIRILTLISLFTVGWALRLRVARNPYRAVLHSVPWITGHRIIQRTNILPRIITASRETPTEAQAINRMVGL